MFHPIKLFHDFKVLWSNYADVICACLGYYPAYGGSSLLTFRVNLSLPIQEIQDPWNLGKKL
jgi:hypothetical protein